MRHPTKLPPVRRPSTGATRRARRVVGALALGVAAAGSACSAPARPPGTVVVASGTDLESANPLVTVHTLSRQVQRHALLVTLVRYDSTLAPQPYLARSWAWSPDRRTLTLRLFRGLRWHDGVPTTARDAAFTLNAARDERTGYPRAADLAAVASVRAPDDTTLVVAFTAPPPDFPTILAELPIVPAHRLAGVAPGAMRQAAYNTAPVGNGPFRFVSRAPRARWVLERNPDFPAALGGPPRVNRLVIAVVDEATTKFAGLVSGELHTAGIAPTMAALVEADPALRVLTYPVLYSTGIVFNPARPPFDDRRVRRAVDMAIDRDRIVRAAFAGLAIPAAGPVPPASPLALPSTSLGTVQEADSLLDAAGWTRGADGMRARAGVPLAFTLLTVGSADNATEQLVQADLAERGIRMEVRQLELGAFLAAARARPAAFDALVTGIPGDPALAYLAAMYDSRLAGGALDYADFHTPALDALLARAAAAPADGREAAWHAVQRELARETPVAWLYHSRGVTGLSRRLGNVVMDLRGELATVARWTLADEAR